MMGYLRRAFISGLLVWVPIWVTILVIKFLYDLFGNILAWVPRQYQPDALIGFHVPGLAVLIIILVIFFTGAVAANIIGSRLVGVWDAIIARIPLVRSIYMGVKQVLETLFSPTGQSFRKVLLIEYPRQGSWTLAFQTGDGTPEVDKLLGVEAMVSVFVPTTPNPTSGFILMLPRKDVIELSMSVEQALKFVISLGVMQPMNGEKKLKLKKVDEKHA